MYPFAVLSPFRKLGVVHQISVYNSSTKKEFGQPWRTGRCGHCPGKPGWRWSPVGDAQQRRRRHLATRDTRPATSCRLVHFDPVTIRRSRSVQSPSTIVARRMGAKNSRLRGRQNGDKGTRREKLSLANDVVMNDYDRQLTTSGKKIRVGETVATYCKLVHFEHVHVYGRRYCDRRFVTTMRRDRR